MYSSLPERVMEVEKESSGDHFPPQTGCFYFRDSFRECRLLMNKTFLPEWCYISILGFLINQQSTLKIRQTDGLQLGTQGILFTLFFCGPTLPSPIFCQTWKGLCWLCFHVFFFFFFFFRRTRRTLNRPTPSVSTPLRFGTFGCFTTTPLG